MNIAGVSQAKSKSGADWRTAKFYRSASWFLSSTPYRAASRMPCVVIDFPKPNLVLVSTTLSRESIIPGKDRWWSAGRRGRWMYMSIQGCDQDILTPEAYCCSDTLSSSYPHFFLHLSDSSPYYPVNIEKFLSNNFKTRDFRRLLIYLSILGNKSVKKIMHYEK